MTDQSSSEMANVAAYDTKPDVYFEGARKDFVEDMPDNPEAHILEIGCSNGNTGALALSMGKCGRYTCVEMNEAAAARAKEKVCEVLVGDIERLEFPWEEQSFDVLILSEVLEHLVDPWRLLQKLHKYLKPGALVFASSPNISHYKIILMLLKGRWDLTDVGVMDRTHLRWFTPDSFKKMFSSSGYDVISVKPISPFKMHVKLKLLLLLGRGQHQFYRQICLKAIKYKSHQF
ncbi:MAG: class I SAM-dependent methyltransferase [Thiotrichaceae bacterium]|nr:class I SAM-dependent methyltransferase [Thiotrichaceae bacterium]